MVNELSEHSEKQASKYLLIPCLAAGMGSVLQGAVSGLLYAEITGRVPLVYWHPNCKYLKAEAEPFHNAFLDFYKPTCPAGVEELLLKCRSSFPEGVDLDRLHPVLEEFHRGLGDQDSHLEDLSCAAAEESELLVFPAYMGLRKIIDLIPENHALSEPSIETVTSWVSGRYLEVCDELLLQVDGFWREHFSSYRQVVTVHIRGGDKYQESIMPRFSRYKDAVDRYLSQHPKAGLFLATDSSAAVSYFKKCFGDRVVTTPALRSSGRQGVHKSGADGRQVGNEILFDVECLSRGDHFVGFDESNVYFWVSYMTELGQKGLFTHMSVRSGIKEIISNRQSFKLAVKLQWKRLFRN